MRQSWDARYHLRVLAALGVLEPDPDGRDPLARRDTFDLPCKLTIAGAGDEG